MITAVVLAYNEEGAVDRVLEGLAAALAPSGRDYRLVVVDDGSTDATAARAEALAPRLPVTVLRHGKNRGVGAAFDTGLRHAAQGAGARDVVVTLEGDLTNDPAFVTRLVEAIDGGADIACASRMREGGRYIGFPVKRLVLSLGVNWILDLFFPLRGVRDYTLFYRAYRGSVLVSALSRYGGRFIELAGFTANAEVLYKTAGAFPPPAGEAGSTTPPAHCVEVPFVYRYDRKPGTSAMRLGRTVAEYGRLFSALGRGAAGVPFRQTAALFAAGVVLGGWGLGWGLPHESRLRPLLPESLQADPGFRRRLADHWRELYGRLEASQRLPVDILTEPAEIAPGWSFPPDILLNTYRSFFIRSCNPDEQKNLVFLAHMKPRQLNFEPYGVGYGGAYLYPLGAWYAAGLAVRAVRVSSDLGTYLEKPRRMARVFLAGRWFNVLGFAACAALVAVLGRRLGGPALGELSGVLFLCLPAVAMASHNMNPYGWATMWCLAGYALLWRWLEEGSVRDLRWSAACLGLCIGSSMAYWSTSLAVPLAALNRLRAGARLKDEAGAVAQAAGIAMAVFVVTNPYLFLKFSQYRGEIVYTFSAFPWVVSVEQLRRFLSEFLAFNMGPTLAAATVGWALWRGAGPGASAPERLAAWMFLFGAFQLSMRVTDPQHGRHLLPYLSLGAVLAGQAVLAVARRSRAAGLAVGVAIALPSAAVSASHLWNMGLEARGLSSRVEAGRWINEHLMPGSSIGLISLPQPYDTPPFRLDRYRLLVFPSPSMLAGRELPDYMVVGEQRRDPDVDAFLARHYRVIAGFGPRRLIPGLEVRSLYTMTNTRIDVFELME